MFMIKSGFLSKRERRELESVVRCPSEDHGIARKCNALLLLDDGWSCERASQVLYLDDDTIRTWYKKYAEGGFDLILHDRRPPKYETSRQAGFIFGRSSVISLQFMLKLPVWKTGGLDLKSGY
ncbi:MAG: helix-turn-helix domain-containing protein [Robiginitomaculum sp.]